MINKGKLRQKIFKVFDLLPANFGAKIYHFGQRRIFGDRIPLKIRTTLKTFNEFRQICKDLNIPIGQKVIIEVGSGWLPLSAYHFFYLEKALAIHTYDLQMHFNKRAISKLNQIYADQFQVNIKPSGELNLPAQVNYYPNTNITTENCLGDIVYSRFVLEHVPPEEILSMHLKFKTTLKPKTKIFHFISPSDHRAYGNNKMSLQDFLKYSKEEWEQKMTSFDYHNRLRLPQYQEIFDKAGLKTLYLNFHIPKKDHPNYARFKKLKIHEDFKKFTDEQLMAGAITIVLEV